MFRGVCFLGTSSGVPTRYRNVSSSVLLHASGAQWLFDCGEGTQHQLQRADQCSLGKIEKIFITHLHGDHCYGLPGLMCSMSMQWGARQTGGAAGDEEEVEETAAHFSPFSERCDCLEVVGPPRTAQFLRSTFACSEAFLPFRYRVIELHPTAESRATTEAARVSDILPYEAPPVAVVADEHGICVVPVVGTDASVFAAFLTHRVTSLGFVAVEPPTQGALDVKKAEALGVAKGPLMGQLKNGATVTLPNGTVVAPNAVVGPPVPGRKYVHLGDTCNSDNIIPIAQNADWLVHECTFDDASKHLAEPRGHSTARMAGSFARVCQAKTLLLTHFSARFLPKSKDATVTTNIERQAQEECPDCVVAAVEDLQLVEFTRKRG